MAQNTKNSEEIQQEMNRIKKVYIAFQQKIQDLKKRQNEVIKNILKRKDEDEINQIRKSLNQ